jgi:hypothetical protein
VLSLFYALSDEREYSGDKLIPRKLKSKDIDYILDKGHNFDRDYLFTMIKKADSIWYERKVQDLKTWH